MNPVYEHGLISKAGKFSYDRFKILKERDQILQKSFKKPVSSHQSPKKKKSLILDILKSLAHKDTEDLESLRLEKDSISKPESNKSRSNPSQLLYKEFSNEEDILPRQFYTPSYKAQDKHIPSIKFQHSPSESRKKAPKIIKEHYHSAKKLEKKIKKLDHPPSCLPFKKQLPRKSFWIYSNLHDNRFSYTPTPVFIKPVPDFNKQTSRKMLYKIPENFPEYNPKKDSTMKKISINIIFDKFLNREQESIKNIIPDPYDVKFECIQPKIKFCKFKPKS